MRALMIGDVFGGAGLDAVVTRLPELRERHRPDLVVVNAENAADGAGTSPRQARALREAGADILTGGNHTLRRKELAPLLASEPWVLRPANIAVRAPGRGLAVVELADGRRAAVINLMGAIFMEAAQSPFAVIDELVNEAASATPFIFVDFHAEATSEKIALARHLAGRVTALVGTHTHVRTADARVLAGGTAYVTDLGMSGPHDSVIGVRSDIVIDRFLTGRSERFEPAVGDVRVEGVLIEADGAGRAVAIRSFSLAPGD